MKRQWKFLKCEKCVNHGKCKEEKRLRKMRFLIPGCMVNGKAYNIAEVVAEGVNRLVESEEPSF